jgi:predicted nucleic acid-binding Zn ribbon protein
MKTLCQELLTKDAGVTKVILQQMLLIQILIMVESHLLARDSGPILETATAIK